MVFQTKRLVLGALVKGHGAYQGLMRELAITGRHCRGKGEAAQLCPVARLFSLPRLHGSAAGVSA